MRKLSDTIMAKVFEEPGSYTGEAKKYAAYRKAIQQANQKGDWDNHRSRCLSTTQILLLAVITLALVFGTGVAVGMRMTNDYYEEVTR